MKKDMKIGRKVEVEWAYCMNKTVGIQLGTLTFEYLGDLEWKKTFTSVQGEIVDEPFALAVTQPSLHQGEDHAKRIKAGKAHSAKELVKLREERLARREAQLEKEKEKAEKPSTLPDSGPKP